VEGFQPTFLVPEGFWVFGGRFLGLDPIFVAKGQQLKILSTKMGGVMFY